MKVASVRKTDWHWVRPWQWFWLTFGWNRGSHIGNNRHLNVKPAHNLAFVAIANSVWQNAPRLLSVKFAIDGSTRNVSKSVTQNMIAWKISFGCAHSAVKMIRLAYNFLRTVRGDTKGLLDAVKILYPNLQFTFEETDDKKEFAVSRHVN